jgi:glycosyltransferase involved in cell wall biosynthesis
VRVLFVVRPSAFERVGGDFNEALYKKRGLEAAGIHVDIAATLEPDARGYDLAHLFGVFDPEIAQLQIAACKKAGARLAITPIWWDYYEFYGRSRGCERALAGSLPGIEHRLARVRRTPADHFLRRGERRKYPRRLAWQTALMREADVLLPNSIIEAHFIRKLRLADRPIVVVHHAVDVPPVRRSADARVGVMCAARIEPKKNQAMLLYALRDLDVEITLTGACYEPDYLKLCRRFMTPRVRWLGSLGTREEVLRLMTRTAVHVMPSWAELPGLSSLEAAAMGARVVVSNDATECEYFGEHALYVDPEDPGTIRAAVEAALATPPRESGDELDRHLAQFTVADTVRRTLEGYHLALAV